MSKKKTEIKPGFKKYKTDSTSFLCNCCTETFETIVDNKKTICPYCGSDNLINNGSVYKQQF